MIIIDVEVKDCFVITGRKYGSLSYLLQNYITYTHTIRYPIVVKAGADYWHSGLRLKLVQILLLQQVFCKYGAVLFIFSSLPLKVRSASCVRGFKFLLKTLFFLTLAFKCYLSLLSPFLLLCFLGFLFHFCV